MNVARSHHDCLMHKRMRRGVRRAHRGCLNVVHVEKVVSRLSQRGFVPDES